MAIDDRLRGELARLDPGPVDVEVEFAASVGRGMKRVRRRRVVAGTALLTVLTCVVAAALATVPDSRSSPVATEVEPDTWKQLPSGPLSARAGHALVWTGRTLIVWGGYGGPGGEALDDGAAYDPATGSWERIPPAPLPGRAYAAATWTGTEMVVWGGASQAGGFGGGLSDGAAYDPEARRWRILDHSPLEPRVRAVATWTGKEVLVVAGTPVQDGAATSNSQVPAGAAPRVIGGAAYDPATDRWRVIAPSPLPESAPFTPSAWTGMELVVAAGGPNVFAPRPSAGTIDASVSPAVDGSATVSAPPTVPAAPAGAVATAPTSDAVSPTTLPPRPVGTPPPPIGPSEPGLPVAAYNPATDRWRSLPRIPVDERSVPMLTWTGKLLVAVNPTLAGAVFDPVTKSWTPFAAPPPSRTGTFTSWWTGREVLVAGSTGLAFDPAARRWRTLPGVELPNQVQELATAWTGKVLVVWGGFGPSEPLGVGLAYRPPR